MEGRSSLPRLEPRWSEPAVLKNPIAPLKTWNIQQDIVSPLPPYKQTACLEGSPYSDPEVTHSDVQAHML